MADWVHCNTCFRQPKSSLAFSLTNCGHLFCSECLSAMKGKCKMCGSSFMAIPITSQMKPDVQIFFTDPAELERKHNKTLLQVIDFQKTHRQRFIAHLQKQQQAPGMSALQNQFKQLKTEAEKRITSLMQENAQLKQMLEGRMGGSANLPMTPHTPKSPHYRLSSRTPSPHSAASTVSTQRSMNPGMKTPGGPPRLSVRTPPSNGRIGPVAGRTMGGEPGRTPSVISNLTTGKTPDIQKAIPMDLTSPTSGRAHPAPAGATSRREGAGNRSTSPARWDPDGRQIHLHYQPKSAVWQKKAGVYTSPKS
ncbi:probable E3 SUMO-protein ligase RNF212 [Sycon ciliatum]|uniref:probable E3 SUMO-protein ligase RNF212 n=1 Tax=Sycon ciliatum TaxID=27933 RepID=UPI0031F6B2F1|eukprot:scpid60539/ scgid11513/ RING finger protein 212